MSNSYLALNAETRKELEAFPMQFAFNMKQFEEGMKSLGLTKDDTDKIVSIPGGGFVRKTDADAFMDLFKRHREKHLAAIAADTEGTGYIYEMFDYELGNHEYSYTYDPKPALTALGLTLQQVKANPIMLAAFNRARAAQFKTDNTEQP